MKFVSRNSLPYIIAGSALVITIMSWFFTFRSVQLYNTARFNTFSDSIHDDIDFRMKTYINTLAQTKGMFNVSPYLTRAAFRDYTKDLAADSQYRSLQALGVIEKIKSVNLQSHISQARSEGFTNYNVWPYQKKSEYYTVINIEPMNQHYRKLIGFDVFTEPFRKKALEIARDTGKPSSTRFRGA